MLRSAPSILVVTIALTLVACAKDQGSIGSAQPGGRLAVAVLKTAAGVEVGRATVREVVGGLRVTIDGRMMPAGTHGAHIHRVGQCAAPDFATAGAHWNPTATQHGSMNAMGPHQGDLPNLLIGSDGRGTLGINVQDAQFGSLLDADGAAMVIHAAADDLKTDPSGNSGARIACGIFVAN